MVCCNYISHNSEKVTYAYGSRVADMTGVISFDVDGGGFEIVKEPLLDAVYLRSINRLYNKHKADFAKGIFREKISYEA